MPQYYFENGYNVRYNRCTVVGDGPCSYNAVLDVSLAAVATEPVTSAEVKAYGKIDTTADDTLITSLIIAAREICEAWTNVSFVQRAATVIVNNSLGGIYLPYGPVGAITSMHDENGEEIVSGNYELRGTSFKTLHEPTSNYVKLVYAAGYTTLPEALKTAVKAQTMWMYEHRTDGTDEKISPIAKMILAPFRRNTV